jgi:hypothetical protein
MLQNVHEGLVDPQLLFKTDGAYFHLSGYVNSQNMQIWSDEKTHAFHQVPLRNIQVGVWCAASARPIISRVFFYET